MATAAVQIPTTHKGVIYDNPGKLSLKVQNDLQTPEPGPGEVLIQLTHSGVCHSDYSVMTNGWKMLPAPTQAGQVGGHEGVGRVVKLGPGAEVNVKIGDRVGIKWVAGACGNCGPCLGGHDGVCFNQKISGYFTPGTFQQYALGPANYVTPIPDNVDSAAAAPFLCGGVTVYAGLKKTQASAGEYIAVMGAGGGLGHLAVQIAAKGMGMRVIGIDHSSKKDFVLGEGAEHFFGFDKEADIAKAVQGVTNGLGVHGVLVLTASNKAYEQSIGLARYGGHIVCIGLPEGDLVPIASASPAMLAFKELSIHGSAVGTRKDAIETLDMAARGVVKMHYTVKKMEDLPSIFEEMEQGKMLGRTVIDLS